MADYGSRWAIKTSDAKKLEPLKGVASNVGLKMVEFGMQRVPPQTLARKTSRNRFPPF